MKSFRVFIIALLAFLGCFTGETLAGVPAPAPARGADQQRVRWKGRTIKIAISTSLTEASPNIKTDSDVIGALRRSLDAWQRVANVDLQLVTSDKQSVSASGPAGDRVSLITIAQTPENVLLFAKGTQAEAAKTRVFYNRNSFITEADIVLNPFQQFSTDGTFGTFDLESTFTHEIGHVLGLRHQGVLGATMSDTISRNGTLGFSDFSFRTLAASDIAAVREIYGISGDDEACCASVAGKLTLAADRSAKLRVWAENSATGRVMAQSDVAGDGTFKIGGLEAGVYSLYWQKRDDSDTSSSGDLGRVRLAAGEIINIEEKISFPRSELGVNFIGLNSQLTDSAVPLAAGREYMIYLGGKSLSTGTISIGVNSPFISIDQESLRDQDFGDGVSVISLILTVESDAPSGVYSIYSTSADGTRCTLIGALNVEN